jgi:Mu transposase, C-terminal domain
VRFDSIPHTQVRRPLTLLASPTTVLVIAGVEDITRHVRSYDSGQVIEQETHVAGLVAATRQANPSRARDRLHLAVRAVTTLLDRLAGPR